MDEREYPVLENGQRVAVNTGYHVLPGVVREVSGLEVIVVLCATNTEKTFARFDVFAIPAEATRLMESVLTQHDTMIQRVNKIRADGAI